MPTVFGPAVQEVLRVLKAQGKNPAGPVFAHHLTMAPGVFDFELGFPVVGSVAPAERVEPGHRAAQQVVRTTYSGPYEGLPAAWGSFTEWVAAEGMKTAPDLWEVYAVGPASSPDASTWRTEFIRPLLVEETA